MLISIAIPCYRSEKTLPFVVEEIDKVFRAQSEHDYEIILVNDGSPDNTFDVITELCANNSKITGINLSRNFGQSCAKMASVSYVNGDVLVTMDDDGQHPAEGIFTLVDKVMEGYDLVYALFPQKKHSLFKRITSDLQGALLTFTGAKEKDTKTSSFVAYSKFAIKVMQESKSPVNAMSSYIRKLTKKVTNVEINHRERLEGESNYTIKKMFKLWRNSITSFNTAALNLSIYLGMFCACLGFLYAVVILFQKIFNPDMMLGYASLMIAVLILCGTIMFLLGILGEYIGKIFLILCKMPNYQVRDEILNKNCDK